MRHVQLKEFLGLPEGTVYMIDDDNVKGVNNIFDLNRPLKIKGYTLSGVNDWAQFDLVELKDVQDCGDYANFMELMHEHGQSIAVDDQTVGCRYGLYPKEGEIAFYVLDEDDTRAVVGLLEIALSWLKKQ